MLFTDTYLTIRNESTSQFIIKGSRFISFSFSVSTEEGAKARLKEIKQLHPSATHHCFAWVLGPAKSVYRYSDDGEPSGTAGRPIYNQIISRDLTNVLVIVVRYFGGTMLGAAGLVQSYKEGASSVLDLSDKTEYVLREHYRLVIPYPLLGKGLNMIREAEGEVSDQTVDNECILSFSIRKTDADILLHKLKQIPGATVTFIHLE